MANIVSDSTKNDALLSDNPFINLRKKQGSVNRNNITTAVPVIPGAEEHQDDISPFDTIKHQDQKGEYWLAKELQAFLGYNDWYRFRGAIERAATVCENTGYNSTDHICSIANMVTVGSGAQRESIVDYRLTRYACYLIAMNGDVRKPEIAAAQTYFAVKTRQAELQTGQQQTLVPKTTGEMFMFMAKAFLEQEQKISAIETNVQDINNSIGNLTEVDVRQQETLDKHATAIQELQQQRLRQGNNSSSLLTEELQYDPITAEGDITIREFSDILTKDLGYRDMGIISLNRYLVDNGILQQLKKGYKAKKRYLDLGWFVNKTENVQITTGDIIERFVVQVTPRGRKALLKRIENRYE